MLIKKQNWDLGGDYEGNIIRFIGQEARRMPDSDRHQY